MGKVNEGKVEDGSRIKFRNGRLAVGMDEVRIWKDYFKDLSNMDTKEQIAVHMYGFDDVIRGSYFEGEPIRKTEVEARVRKL